MAGGLMQLVATGVMDTYLTGNPQITYFKSVFRRYTNFSIESRKLNFNGNIDFGHTNSCTISKGPDLLHKVYLQAKLPAISKTISTDEHTAFRWLNWVGHKLIKTTRLVLGGVEIDRYSGEWLHIWNELSQKPGHKEAYAEMVGNVPGLTQISTTKGDGNSQTLINEYTLYVPLQFWFCKNPGLSIPLVSLQYSDVEIEVEFETLDKLIWASNETSTNIRNQTGSSVFSDIKLTDIHIYADYIYLDNDERKRFAQNSHEYLIEVVQEKGTSHFDSGNDTRTFSLTFTHPVKELVWIIQPIQFIDKDYCQSRGGCQPFNFSDHFDHSGFSGTPEPTFGPGMMGGRTNSNLLYSLPGVKLPFIKDVLEPNFSINDNVSAANFNKDSGSILKTDASTAKLGGYDFISKYHNGTTTPNKFIDKKIENYLGNTTALIVDETTPDNDIGIWSNSNLNLKLTDSGSNPVKTASVFLNGVRRFDDREGFYFNTIQPYQHHTNSPAVGINVYSFALEPENQQPSGTCNFSRIDDGQINVTLTTNAKNRQLAMRVYALSYNILRIMNGNAALAYST